MLTFIENIVLSNYELAGYKIRFFFGYHNSLKLLNNLDWTSKLLPSKNEIHSHKGFKRVCVIEWE